jgi:hypothetical protein
MTFLDEIMAGAITWVDREILSRYMVNVKPRVSSELQNILYEKYASDIDSLENFISRDLSGWRPN